MILNELNGALVLKLKNLLKNIVLNVFGTSRYKRFIVLSRGRSGSNLLKSYLNSHPNIKCRGELFRRLDGRNYREIFDSAFQKQLPRIKALGFKLFYYHPEDDMDMGIWNIQEGLWMDLVNTQDLYVIHLKRRNLLRIILSAKIAHTNGVWLSTKKTNKVQPIVVDPKELLEKIEETNKWHIIGDKVFNRQKVLNLYYENLTNQTEIEFKRITTFLNLPYHHPNTHLKKQNKGTLRDTIVNYDELKDVFNSTKWGYLLEE